MAEEHSFESNLQHNDVSFGGNFDARSSDGAAIVPVSTSRKSTGPSSFGLEVPTSSAFTVTISSPSKVESSLLNTHTEYMIHVKTSLNHYKNSEFSVARRYSDFNWLREQLAENNKGYLIPPLPEKAVLNRFNAEFVEYRRKELERFLQRVVAHHHLCQSPDLQAFFETEKAEGGLVKKSVDKSQTQGESKSGFLSFLSTTPTLGVVQDPDPWFDSKKNYISSLETHYQLLTKNLNTYIRKKKETVAAFAEFGVSCSLTASAEADHDSTTSGAFNHFADIITQANDLEEKRMSDETGVFEDSLKDYHRLLQAVKEMLAARQDKLTAYHNASKSLETKREKLEKTKGNAKLEQEVNAAQELFTKTELEFNQVSAVSRAELQQFEATKLKDIKALLVQYTQININFELQMADFWKQLMGEM